MSESLIMVTKRNRLSLMRFIIVIALVSTFVPGTSQLKAQGEDDHIDVIAWSPDGNHVAMGNQSGQLRVWDTTTGNVQYAISNQARINDIAWSPNGDRIAVASEDQTIRLWNASNGNLLNTLTGHTGPVTAITWSADGKKLISGGIEEDQNLRIWNASTGQLLASYEEGTIIQLLRSPSGQRIAAIGPLGFVDFLDPVTYEPMIGNLVQPEGSTSGYDIFTAAWSPDENRIAVGSRNGVVRVWDVARRQILFNLHGNDEQAIAPEVSAINSIAFSADGTKLFSFSNDGVLRQWNADSGQVLGTNKVTSGSGLYSAAWSIYSGRLAFGNLSKGTTTSQSPAPYNGTMQIVVPFPSLDELQGITKRCVPLDAQKSLLPNVDTTHLSNFLNAMNGLPKDRLSSACSADLHAMVNALQTR